MINHISLKFKNLKSKIIEYFKFNLVGIINFAISQIIYLSLYLVFHINYIISYTIVSIISITASYYFNSKYTFKNNHYSLKKYIFSILVYIFEYILNICIILFLVNSFNINKAIAPIITPVFSTIPVFFLMRFIIKNTDKDKHIN